jgi:hypothetical protein
MSKKASKRRIVKRANHHRRRRRQDKLRDRRQSPMNWPPDFPADLDLAFQKSQATINSLAPPSTGKILKYR